ncbi:PP2C family protein-serine/threonine phosphatase [Saccharothrix lopnurensis]|uniref:PP2C family protein-serine/threonine phosphatase n=1 Tax=Saccharothrix lopnurensis TaxID=1670621 RepID=A0ABW1P4Q1_9PSEU
MTATPTARRTVGAATSRGPNRPRNADAHAHHVHHGVLAAAVVDGTGSGREVVEFAAVAATTAARVAARRTPVLGLVAAAEAWTEPLSDAPGPDGAVVVASVRPGGHWRIAWAGDSAAYGLKDDGALRRFTSPHTVGEELRRAGAAEAEAAAHDHQLLHSLARVPVGGVEGVEAIARLLVLASDGLKLPPGDFAALLAGHGHDPGHCAELLVEAAREHGSRDDVTVLVLPYPGTGAVPEPESEERR